MAKDFSFEAADKRIEQVLFSHRKFSVPRYQRPYTWGIDQVSEFWNTCRMQKDIKVNRNCRFEI
jgi:uncharacterized protein with ParB-like and HNH nuclease domain